MLTAFFQRASASLKPQEILRSVFLVAVKCYGKQKRWIHGKDLLVLVSNAGETV